MKRHLLLFVMAVLLMLPAALKAQDTVQIGNNDFGLAYLPTFPFYYYALSQQIYTATEIGRSGTIYSIAIRVNSGNVVRNLDIYMLHTNKTAFDGRYDWVPVTAADRVFSGYVNFPSQTWSTIELSAPFHYNGTDNLLIVVDDNSNSFDSYDYSYFGGYYLSSKQSIYVYGDDTDYDPANPSSYSGNTEYRKNVIQLSFAPISCHAPAITSFSNISQTSATMSWSQLGGATEWQVCMSGDEANAVTVTTNSYTFTGLTPYTNYTVKVRAICGSDTTAWSTGIFTTLPTCLFPTDLTLSNIRSKSVTLGWTEHNGANEWDIGLWYYHGGVSDNSIITVTTNPYTIKNLVPNSHYAIEMRTHCSGNDNSPWSSQWMQFYTTDNATETLVEIGSGNSLHDSLPTNIHDKYSLSQQIYTAAEIDRSGRIYNVSLYSTDATETRDLDVYMVHTSKTNFADSQDWVSVNPADLVFSGEVTFVANDWTRIDFSVPFDYNGTDNVILVVDDNSGSQSGSRHFLGFDAPGQAISIFNNQTDYNPSNPNAYNGNTLDYKNQIQLGFIPSICLKPASFALSNIGPNTVDLSWTELGDATAWQVCVNGDENNLIDVNSTNFNLRSLAPETDYTVKVRANCGGSEGVGPWSESLSFTTVSLDPLVEIGSSVNSHHALPTHARYNFSVSHQIYTAEEIGQAGDIYHVAFINTSSTCTRNIDIYMMHTNKTSFSSADDWDPATSADLVFSGNVEFLSNEWTTIELQNPFAYNGNDNLMLVVDDNSYSVTNFTYFSTFNTSSYQSLYRYTHGFNPDPLDSIGYGSQLMRGTARVKNHIQLGFSPIACPVPKSLTVTNIGSNSATLNWTQDGTATEWQICVNGDESNPIVADSTSYILTGLTPETNYTVKVRANCGNIDGMSVWTTEKSFTTYPCVVSNIQAIGMAGGKAMVSWEGHADSYILRYKPEGGSSWTTLTNITGLTYTITGLPVGNNIVEVAPDCAPTNFISATCSVAEVLSTANWYGYAIVSLNSANWAYKFISFSMQDPATLTTATATTAAYYYAAAYANGYVWAIDDYSNLYRAVLDNSNRTISDFVTVVYSIDTETVRSMSYNPIDHKMYYITENSLKNFHPDSPESVSKIGDLAHPLQTLAINSSGVAYGVEQNTGNLYRVNLTDATLTLVGNTGRNCNYVQGMAFDQTTGELFWAQIYSASDVGLYKIDPTTANTSFLGQIGGSGAELTGLFMGDDNQPSCIAPVKTTISEVGPYSAKVSWTGPANGNEWEYQYSTSPDFSTNTVSDFVNNPHIQLTGLTSETTYYVRVRTSCGSTEVSYWDATKTFTTTVPCPAPYDLTTSDITDNSVHIGWTGFGEDYIVEYRKRNILFFDDFGNDLSQWTLIDADGDGYNWHTLGTTSGGKVAVSESFVNGPGALTPDNWLVSPQMELGDMVSFWAKGVASWAGEHFAIFVSTTGTNPSDFTQVSEEFVTTTSYKKYTADLSAFTGQQGYVAIRHFNVTDIYYLIVGNFTVWDSEPWQTASTGTDSIILHGLYPETYYEVRVQSNCGSDGISGWGVPLLFTTESPLPCITPTNLTVANVTPNSIELSWTENGTATEWQVCVNGDETNPIDVTENPYTLSGLASGTSYTVKVRANCGANGTSYWSNEVSFSTWSTTSNLVEIGSCTSGNENLPSNSYYNYGLSQQIYTPAEIGRAGAISRVSFYNDGDTKTRNYDMYLIHTSKSAFDNTQDWVPVTPADLVFSGSVEMIAGAWTTLDLDVPFTYNGIDNLLLVMDDNTHTWSQGMSCYAYPTTAHQALSVVGDNSNYDPSSLTGIMGDFEDYKNCIKLDFSMPCPKPQNLTASITGQDEVTMSWVSNATDFVVNYKKTTDTQWQEMTVTTNTATLSGLDPVAYEARVKAVCDPGVSESDWVTTTFSNFDVQSTANWYCYAYACPDHPEWENNYISFSMQNLASAAKASDLSSTYNPRTSTYANGYVWSLAYDYNTGNIDLFRAMLDNTNKTIGNFEPVMSAFDTMDISSMAYNPVDGKIYYLRADHILVSFDPSSPDVHTVIGTYTEDFTNIAINGSGEAYCLDFQGDLYRVSTTDASADSVGNIPDAAGIAFDTETNEFFSISNDAMVRSVDPATANYQELYYIGGAQYSYMTDLFMVGSTANVCYAPTVYVSAIGMHQADISWMPDNNVGSWMVEYGTDPNFIGAVSTTVTTNSILLTGLTSETVYYVRVKANCGNIGESFWTVRSFNTDICEPQNQCAVNYSLSDSYGDGWNGCAIQVRDVLSGIVTNTLTMDDGYSMGGYFYVCSGREISFEWIPSNFDNETSYSITDPEGNLIFSGSDAMTAPVTYTVNCPAQPCSTPDNLAVSGVTENTATLSWTETGNAAAWQICVNGDETNPIDVTTTPYTLSGLNSGTPYTVKVRANCGVNGTSSWSNEVSFSTVFSIQSSANWYGFASYSSDNPNWMSKYIGFSMQDLSTADTASAHYDNYPSAAAYANGYVWTLYYDNNYINQDLYRAPLDNNTRTIGHEELVKTGFETEGVSSMSYNPVDGRIYYLRADQKLASFDPADPDVITEIGTYNEYFDQIAINGSGEAYGLEYTGDLYQISLADASTVFVGNIPDAATIAFDQVTGELFCAAYSNVGQVICAVNPTTAAKQELGYVGGDTTLLLTRMFMVGGTANICYAPEAVTVSAIGMNQATVSWTANTQANGWVVEYGTAADFTGSTTVNVTANTCALTGLTSGTIYHVRVKANCGGGSESYWTVRSFNTSICEAANQCEISYELVDSWNDGWNGCAINVVDVASDIVVATLTMNDGDTLYGTLPVCDGREIRFEWVDGYAPNETSYTVYDPEGNVIFTGSDVLSTPVTYVVSCPTPPCPAPTNLVVSNITEYNAMLSWTENGSATSWQVCINGDEAHPVNVYSNPKWLDELYMGTDYTVKVRANCGADGYSQWSDEVSFTTEAPPPFFYIDGDDSICPGQTTILYVNTNMGTNYLWSNGETSQSITVPVGIYSVTVSKNGNTVAYGSFEVKAKKTYDITVTDAVCASSLPYMWNGDPYTASGSYPKTFTASNGCDSVVTLVLTVNPSDNSDFTETVCDSYTWEGTTYTQSGDYTKNFTNTNGCDSIVTLHLTINSSENSEFAETACDLFTWAGTTYAQSGNYTKTFTNTSGCDSTVTLHLTVNHPQHQAYTETAYDTYTWANGNGQTYTVSGNYLYSHSDANGCMQVDTLHLTVFYSSANEFSATACESYEWDGIVYTVSGDYPRQYQDIHGADSVVTMHLTINHGTHNVVTETACESYTWHGTEYTTSGTYTHEYNNADGCASADTLKLTVNHPQHQAYTETAYDTYTWANGNGQTYTVSGNYLYSHPDANGCTQVDTLHLTVFYSSANEFSATACESYEWDGIVYTMSGDYPRQYQDIHGADSVVTLHLTINHGTHNVVTETACESFTWFGTEYTTSGTFTHEYNNADGCASVDTLKLTVNHGTHNVVTETACESFTWYGTEYTTSGNFTHQYNNADGCVSVDTLKLTVNHGTHNVVTETACESFTWYGTEYTTSGTFTHEYNNADGCASVDTLKLTVNHGTHNVVTETACESFTWYGTEYITSGTFTHEYNNADGCASVDTLKLTVNHGTHNVVTETACERFTWYGTVYNTSGTFTHEYTNADGCTSVDTLKLTVNHGTHNVVTETACESFTWYGTEYTTSGTYTHEYINNDGCASVDTLKLIVNHGTHNVVTETACESFTWYGTEYNTSGTYTHEYTNNDGCASVDTLKLTVNHGTHNVVAETACESFTWYGTEYTTSGTFTHEYTNNDGCASVDTLKLTVNHGTHNVVTETACESFTWYGTVYNTSGTFTHEYTNADGCTSVDTLKLTVNHGTHNVVTETACESFTWYGTEYTTSGTYTHEYINNNGCASVDTLKLTVNHGTHNVVTETACESFTWYGTEYTTSGTYTHEYINNNGCASVDTLKLTINHGTHNVVTETACESYTWHGTEYTTSGTFTHEYTNNDGCASVDTLKLTVNHGTHNVVTETACESFTWYGTEYTTSGTYTHEYINNNGCASVDTLKLTINHGTHNVVTETACESYTWHGTEYTTSGTYTHEYNNADGCPSVDTLHLTINFATFATFADTACGSYTWHGQTYTTSGTYTYNYTNATGCTSVDTLKLTVNQTYNVTDTRSVCPSEMPYTWNGLLFNAAGAQTVTLPTISGCDSVVTMILTVNQTHVSTDSRTICQSELPYTWNGVTFNAAGVQTATLQDANGCDSTVIMTLTVNPTYNITLTHAVCQSELPYTWNGVVFNAAGSQNLTLQTANGCDSLVTLVLTVNPTYNVSDTRSVCPNDMPYTWNGVTFNAAGAQTVTLQTANGCDSVVTMILTVNQTHVTTDSRIICQSELPYTWNGVTFNAAGVQTATLPDANGCDSTVIMTLTVNPTYNIPLTQAVCESELPYTWNGLVFTAAGSQTLSLQTVNGCDSIVTMTLTVNYGTHNVEIETACESYEWHGVTYTASGTYTYEYTNANGCASVDTLILTVNHGTHNVETETACESYEWHGATYTTSGTYTYEYNNENGCASVDTLHLTINFAQSAEFAVTTADSCYSWNGHLYCESGDYTQTLTAANGCDSVVTLHLTITVGIDDHNLSAAMTVYPNPTNDIVNVQCTMNNVQVGTMEYHVFDAYGKLVDVVEMNANGSSAQTVQIDLSGFANGVYFVKAVADGNVVAVRKVVKR